MRILPAAEGSGPRRVQLTGTEGGHQLVASASAPDFDGPVTHFATSFPGDLLGIKVTCTPQDPPPLVLARDVLHQRGHCPAVHLS